MRGNDRNEMMPKKAYELPGLAVHLDDLVYEAGLNLPDETPHGFVYFLTIENRSDREVIFLGRKWVVEKTSGDKLVIEGDGIVGETPRLQPGERFSYNSFHVTAENAVAYGSFHGVDSSDNPIFVRIPAIEMNIPEVT